MTTTIDSSVIKFSRFEGNPIIIPNPALAWQQKATFNPTAIYENGKVHIIYRAQSTDGISVLGYAASTDGLHIDENLTAPIYSPQEEFEQTKSPGSSTGCKDPRITKINDRLYLTYTAYDGINPPQVAMSSIRLYDFLNKNWQWEKPRLISPPGDKDACIVKNIQGDGYIAFHRLGDTIWIDFLSDLPFLESHYLSGNPLLQVRKDRWDNIKIGIAAPPIPTERGWVLLYHAACQPGFLYKVGALLLDYKNPRKVLARSDQPLMEPEAPYEQQGNVPNIIFPGGAVVMNETIYLYYGCANSVVSVATLPLYALLSDLLAQTDNQP